MTKLHFLMLPCWTAVSPAYVATDICIVTTATHADRLTMSGHTIRSDHLQCGQSVLKDLIQAAHLSS